MATLKDARIAKIIDDAVDYIPNASIEVYDPAEGLADAVKIVKALYDARLRHYITDKEENVRFVARLANYLKEEYPRKPEKEYKPRKKVERSAKSKKEAKERLWGLWAPGGKKFIAQNDAWKASALEKYKSGGELSNRLSVPAVKKQYDKYVSSKGKSTAKK